jgi:hypothetical protein
MAFGKMNTFIDVITTAPVKDAEGFVTYGDTVLASVRAYKETRNTTAKWERIIDNAAFVGVTCIFRFRALPDVTVDTTLFITDVNGRYNIVGAENVAGRGMYWECMCEKVEGSVK